MDFLNTIGTGLSTGSAVAGMIPGGQLLGAGMGLAGQAFNMFGAAQQQKRAEAERQRQIKMMQDLINKQRDAATLASYSSKGVTNPQIYAEGGEIDLSDDDISSNNKEFFEQRAQEIGLEAAAQEYNQVFGQNPEWVTEQPKKKRFSIKS